MKTRTIGTSSSLLLFGAAIILLIGAFARFDSSTDTGNLSAVSVAPPVPGLEPGDATEAAGGPELPANLSPGLDEVIKLAQAHVGDDVILAFVQNSGRTYNPTAKELLYLTDLGLSQKVLAALYSNAGTGAPAASPEIAASADTASLPPSPPDFALAPPSPEPAAGAGTVSGAEEAGWAVPPARDTVASLPVPDALGSQPLMDPTTSYFYGDLSPYGSWLDLGEQGWFWQPTVSVTVIGWQPYRDHGGWSYTESGWYWHSDYSWAWAAFHYGRWLNNPRYGWVWRPGNTWAPAWVAWRNTFEFAGWAPLPPGAPLNLGGRPPSAFGLSASSFTFVSFDVFLKPHLQSFAAEASLAAGLFRSSTAVNNYSVSGGRIFNLGVSTSQISAATHRPVKQFALRDVSTAGSANQIFGRGVLAVYRPVISEKAAASTGGDSRLAQLDASEDPGVPAREVAAPDETRRTETAAGVAHPRTQAPILPGMHTLVLSPAATQSVFPPGHFDGHFKPEEFDHPLRVGEPFSGRGYEPAMNGPAPYDGRPDQHDGRAEARPAAERPAAAESHGGAPSTSGAASGSKK